MTFDKLFSRLILLEAEERHTPRGSASDPKSVLLGRSFSPRGFAAQSSMPTGIEKPEPERFERGSLIERKPELGDAVKGNMRDEEKALYNSIARAMKFSAETPAVARELAEAFKPYIDLHSQMIAYKQMADRHAVRTGDEKSGKELRQQVPKRIDQLLDLEAGANDAANKAETERNAEAYSKAVELRDKYRQYIRQYESEVSEMLDAAKKIAGKLTVVADATLAKIAKIISDAQPVSEVENKQYIRQRISNFAKFIREQRDAIKNGLVPVSGKSQKWWFTLDPVRVLFGIYTGVRNRSLTVQSSVSKQTRSNITDLLQATKQHLDELNSPGAVRNDETSKKVEAAQGLYDDARSLKYILEVVSSAFKPRSSIISHKMFMKEVDGLRNVDEQSKNNLKELIEILKDDSTPDYQGNERAGVPSAETRVKQLIANIVNALSQHEDLKSSQPAEQPSQES